MVVKNNQKGLALLEALPIMLVMFVLMGATLGSWGVVHTAILNSISARHYSFFLFNHRADLMYLRDWGEGYVGLSSSGNPYYRKKQVRFHYISSEKTQPGDQRILATLRFVDFKSPNSDCQSRSQKCLIDREHRDIYREIPLNAANNRAVDPAWIMVGYGICLTAACTPVP